MIEEHPMDHVWFVMNVFDGQEMVVERRLKELGLAAWVPVRLAGVRRARHARSRVQRMVAVFPEYVFVGVSGATPPLVRARSVRGCRGIVRIGGKPRAVPIRVMAALFAEHGIGECRLPAHMQWMDPDASFDRGARCRVGAGPFEGAIVEVETFHGADALGVIEFLGQSVDVRIPVANLDVVR